MDDAVLVFAKSYGASGLLIYFLNLQIVQLSKCLWSVVTNIIIITLTSFFLHELSWVWTAASQLHWVEL